MTILDSDEDEGMALIPFKPVTMVGSDGELKVNAGKYSRAMIVMAFEMMGGVETFAEWAMNNKGDFYTKMFTKTIGRELETPGGTDPVEEYLKILDLDAEDVTPENAPTELAHFTAENLTGAKLAVAAQLYADNEEDD